MTTMWRILVYDATRHEWRDIEVESHYTAKCGNNLHQIGRFAHHCACGMVVAPPKPVAEKS